MEIRIARGLRKSQPFGLHLAASNLCRDVSGTEELYEGQLRRAALDVCIPTFDICTIPYYIL